MKKKISYCFWFLMALLFVTSNVLALEYVTNKTPQVDLNIPVTFTVEFKTTDGTPLSETNFSIYKVADIDKNGTMTINDSYASLNTDFNQLSENEWKNLPKTFIDFVDANKIEPTKSGMTDDAGAINFDECEQGLYLVRGMPLVYGVQLYTPINYFISLPSLMSDNWVYNVKSEPKYALADYDNLVNIEVIKVWDDKGHTASRPNEILISLLKAPKNSDDYDEYKEVKLDASNNWTFTWENLDNAFDYQVEEKNISELYDVEIKRDGNTFIITNKYKDNLPHLPQTGQVWWPVPVFLGCGLVLVALSIMINHTKKDKSIDEE